MMAVLGYWCLGGKMLNMLSILVVRMLTIEQSGQKAHLRQRGLSLNSWTFED